MLAFKTTATDIPDTEEEFWHKAEYLTFSVEQFELFWSRIRQRNLSNLDIIPIGYVEAYCPDCDHCLGDEIYDFLLVKNAQKDLGEIVYRNHTDIIKIHKLIDIIINTK